MTALHWPLTALQARARASKRHGDASRVLGLPARPAKRVPGSWSWLGGLRPAKRVPWASATTESGRDREQRISQTPGQYHYRTSATEYSNSFRTRQGCHKRILASQGIAAYEYMYSM